MMELYCAIITSGKSKVSEIILVCALKGVFVFFPMNNSFIKLRRNDP